jgi:hypothetical protein
LGINEDDVSFVKLGPGAVSGLERIFVGDVSDNSSRGSLLKASLLNTANDDINQVTLCGVLQNIQGLVYSSLGILWNDYNWRGSGLNLKNIEHCLCEFSKYCNVVQYGGFKGKVREYVYLGVNSNSYLDHEVVCFECKKKEVLGERVWEGCESCLGRWCGECWKGEYFGMYGGGCCHLCKK